VQPSLQEGFGLSVVEAMDAGIPVVTTSAGGLSDVVEEGVTGLMVPPGDAEALGQRVEEALADRVSAGRRASVARERVRARYSPEAMAQATLAVYRKALGR
jgi:glycosyltransferase involved in cell wall biosynthesis